MEFHGKYYFLQNSLHANVYALYFERNCMANLQYPCRVAALRTTPRSEIWGYVVAHLIQEKTIVITAALRPSVPPSLRPPFLRPPSLPYSPPFQSSLIPLPPLPESPFLPPFLYPESVRVMGLDPTRSYWFW